jgi:hypothetical protein
MPILGLALTNVNPIFMVPFSIRFFGQLNLHVSLLFQESFVPYRDSVLTWLLKDNLGRLSLFGVRLGNHAKIWENSTRLQQCWENSSLH